MTIRVPNPMTAPSLLMDLQRTKAQYAQYSEQISTGQAITQLGQDPAASALILNFQTSINQNNQYLSQINTSMSYLQNSSTVATSLGTSVTQLQQLAEQGMSGTQSSSSLSAIAAQVDSIYKNLVNLGNTQVEGKYIFGGTDTTTAPFSTTPPTAGPAITYNGNNATINVAVGASQTTPTNVPGDTLFLGGAAPGSYGGTLDVFNAAQSLSQALTSTTMTTAQRNAAIQTVYTNLQGIADHVNNTITQLGGWESSLNGLQSNLTSLNASLTSVQNGVQSVDMATAITNLNQSSIGQQATIAAMSKMAGQTNLFNYLA